MVDANLYVVECHNSFNPIQGDPGEVIGGIVTNKNESHNDGIIYEDDSYEWIAHTDPVYEGIHNIRNREEFGQSINKRMFLEATLFTGSKPIHSFGLDWSQ